MKIKHILLFSFFLLPIIAFGQSLFKRELALGVNGGMIASEVNFVPSIKESYNWRYGGGITVRYISEKHFGLQAEVNYSQRGWKGSYDNDLHYTRSLDYIELPLLTHVYFGRKLRFIVNLGPKLSYMLSDNFDTNFVPGDSAQYQKAKYKFDYGICGGGGFELHTKSLCYILEGRYYFGLGDIYDNGRKDTFMRSANRNISINFTLLYTFK